MLPKTAIILVSVGIVVLGGTLLVLVLRNRQGYLGPATKFKFQTTAAQVAPRSNHPLSKNGPYIDTHFKDMDAMNPIGQTYYQRPVTSYDHRSKTLTIHLDSSQPTIHMNTNTVSTDVTYGGLITITDFTYGKHNPDSVITVNASLHNSTGRQLIGFHVHDGELSKDKKTMGFTNFGPIAYFIHTTKYWVDNATKLSQQGKFPLPLSDATSRTGFPFHT